MRTFELCNDSNMLTKDEALALADCVQRLPANPIIIQIGAAAGLSTCAMIEARPDAFIYSIDIKPCPEERASLIKLGLNYEQVVRVPGNSQTMAWAYGLVDMLYVDGDHREKGIRADCRNWFHRVEEGGLIVFHDYIPKDAPPKNQVARVVDEYFKGIGPFIRVGRVIGFER